MTQIDVGRNKPVRALARIGGSGIPKLGSAGNAHPGYRRAGLFRPTFYLEQTCV
ncbi:MAG: hypothetical protein NTY50_03555 [Methylobacter sp.]|nr:hypothetical protein [Methylobacter sp.]